MTLQGYVLFTHKNHVVKCTRCNGYVLRMLAKRLHSDGNIINTYQCLVCGYKFVCCPRHYDTLPKQIRSLRYRLRRMEKALKKRSY